MSRVQTAPLPPELGPMPRSPKLSNATRGARSHWYPYYAGYSPSFVFDVLSIVGASPTDSLILDPWNGSGTTTAACSRMGVRSIGIDINPVMTAVASARVLNSNLNASLRPLLQAIIGIAKSQKSKAAVNEPLLAWFDRGTATRLRYVVDAIAEILVESGSAEALKRCEATPLACFYLLLMFRLVRRRARALRASNPTWVRSAVGESEKLNLSFKCIEQNLLDDLATIVEGDPHDQANFAEARLYVGDSARMPLESASISTIITSPPYCTRIDYAAATRIELAVLGYSESEFKTLRKQMLGTTLSFQEGASADRLPASVSSLLRSIKSHGSKASSSYYYRTYLDYFLKLSASINEINRVVAPRGSVVMVVQESSYKEIRVDLAHLVTELMTAHGFEVQHKWDYTARSSMGSIKSATKRPVESALTFRRA